MIRSLSQNAIAASLCVALSACAAQDAESAPEQSNASLGAAPGDVAQSFLVIYQQLSVPASAAADVEASGGTFIASYPEIGIVVAQASTQSFVTAMSAKPGIESVTSTYSAGVSALPALTVTHATQKSPRMGPPSKTGEAFASAQWNMSLIRADQARKISPGKKSVVVGVMDSGLDDSHPDLSGQVDLSRSVSCITGAAVTDPAAWRDDANGHGTHVAGIIAAKQNGLGVVGVAPGVSLAAVQVADPAGMVYPEWFICGMYWVAKHNIQLVNASIYIDPWFFADPAQPAEAAVIKATQRAFTFAANAGATTFVAAGNEFIDVANKPIDPYTPTDIDYAGRDATPGMKSLPLELDGALGVSSVGATRSLAFYSSYGYGIVDLAGPGGDMLVPATGNASGQVLSPVPPYSAQFAEAGGPNGWNGRVGVNCKDANGNPVDANDMDVSTGHCDETYALLQGTSMATPHVTGVAALALSKYGNIGTAKLLSYMQKGAVGLACPAGTYDPTGWFPWTATCTGTKQMNGFYGAGLVDALGATQY